MLQVATNPRLLLTLPWLYPGFLEHQFSGSLEHQCGESLQQQCGEIHWRPPSFQLLFPRQRCCCFRDNGTKNKPIRARQGAASKEINWILRVSEAIQDLARWSACLECHYWSFNQPLRPMGSDKETRQREATHWTKQRHLKDIFAKSTRTRSVNINMVTHSAELASKWTLLCLGRQWHQV